MRHCFGTARKLCGVLAPRTLACVPTQASSCTRRRTPTAIFLQRELTELRLSVLSARPAHELTTSLPVRPSERSAPAASQRRRETPGPFRPARRRPRAKNTAAVTAASHAAGAPVPEQPPFGK